MFALNAVRAAGHKELDRVFSYLTRTSLTVCLTILSTGKSRQSLTLPLHPSALVNSRIRLFFYFSFLFQIPTASSLTSSCSTMGRSSPSASVGQAFDTPRINRTIGAPWNAGWKFSDHIINSHKRVTDDKFLPAFSLSAQRILRSAI